MAADPSPPVRPAWLSALRALRWPLVIALAFVVAFLVVMRVERAARDSGRAALDTARELGGQVAGIAARFRTGTITTTFTASIPHLVPDGGTKLELAVYEATETFSRTDDRRVLFELVPLGATVTEIRVPVTYRYHVRLDDPWRLEVHDHTCVVFAPPIRPSLPPAIHTDEMVKQVDRGWLRFDSDDQLDLLERSITPTLSERAADPAHIELVRDRCRFQLQEFIRSWLLLEEQWGEDRFRSVEVFFADEEAEEPEVLPAPTIVLD